jgi:hypothetical protein
MKKSFLIIAFLLITKIALAKCAGGMIWVWPFSMQVSPNTVFILNAYDDAQHSIIALNNGGNAFIFTEGDTIYLKVLKINVGQFNRSQALVKPVRNLKPGKHYKIKIDNYEPDYYYKKDFERGWYVKEKLDNSKPFWKEYPALFSKISNEYGCGPDSYVKFCLCISDESPVAVLTKTKEISTGLTSEYYLFPDSSILSVGYGMCSGAFKFLPGERYASSFSLIDASGNYGSSTDFYHYESPPREIAYKKIFKSNCNCKDTGRTIDKAFVRNMIWGVLTLLLKVSLISGSYI